MKTTKKTLSLVLASLMLLALLAACASPAATTPSGGNTQAPDQTSAPNNNGGGDGGDDGELKAVEVKYQMIGWGSPGDAAMAELSAKVNKVLADLDKPYTVKLMFGEGGDYTDTTNLMLASGGNEFDIIFISNWAANFYANAAAGYLTDLGPYLAKYPDVERILTSDFMNASLVNGKNYALPTNKEKARQLGWVLRKDIVDDMGLDLAAIEALPYGERLAALEPYFYQAKEDYDLWVYPIFVPSDYQYDRIIEPIIMSRVEPGATTALVADLDSTFIDAVKLYSKWYQDGLINPNLNNQSSGNTEFATGQYFGIPYQLKPGKDKELEGEIEGFEFVQIAMNPPEIANSETTGAMVAIPHGAANKNEAFDFINLLYTNADVLNTVIFGEEGIDYEFVGDGIIEITGGGGHGQSWTMGDQFANHLQSNEDPTKWAQFIAFNEAGSPLPLLGFVPNTDDLDIQTYIAGMQAVRENYGDLFRGYTPLDQIDAEFEKLRSEYESAGMNELLEEMQAQIDAWLASK
ncbi:MAG: ABC transporter substrate-binding protein [Oscillospiraceae bacterium]|nr:ABC transporter substrate-binding protein [Oscillospiraceae bacterium]